MGRWLLKCKNCGQGTNTEIYEKKLIDGRVATMIYCDRCPRAAAAPVPAILKGGRKSRSPLKGVGTVAAEIPGDLPCVRLVDNDRARFRDAVDVPGRKVVYCGGYNAEHRVRVLEKKYGIDERYNIISDDGFKIVADPR